MDPIYVGNNVEKLLNEDIVVDVNCCSPDWFVEMLKVLAIGSIELIRVLLRLDKPVYVWIAIRLENSCIEEIPIVVDIELKLPTNRFTDWSEEMAWVV